MAIYGNCNEVYYVVNDVFHGSKKTNKGILKLISR